jgi:hypothetical protein
VAVAAAVLVVSAAAIAVTATVSPEVMLAGAVYRPAVLILPQSEPEHVKVHVTATLLVPVTVALNCCVLPTLSEAVAGKSEIVTPATRVTAAVAVLVLSALAVAVTVTVSATLIGVGAV